MKPLVKVLQIVVALVLAAFIIWLGMVMQSPGDGEEQPVYQYGTTP